MGQHRDARPGDAGIHGWRSERAQDIGESSQSQLNEMFGQQVTTREVVDAHQIVSAAVRKGGGVAVGLHSVSEGQHNFISGREPYLEQ